MGFDALRTEYWGFSSAQGGSRGFGAAQGGVAASILGAFFGGSYWRTSGVDNYFGTYF